MHYILLGNEMAPPVCHNSIIWVEQALTIFTDDDAVVLPDDGENSSLPFTSSPDLPDMDEFYEILKRGGARHDSPASLPNSSPPTSPAPYEDEAFEEDEPYGQVYLFDKAGEDPLFFNISLTKGTFCLLNSPTFLEQSHIVTHSVKVYNAMLVSFVDLPPTAYWWQYLSPFHYLILKDKGLEDAQCTGLDNLIWDLNNSVNVMALDPTCLNIWHQKQVQTPLSTQVPIHIPSPIQEFLDTEQDIQISVGKKRKHSEIKDEVAGPPMKLLKYSQMGSGSSTDPIVISDKILNLSAMGSGSGTDPIVISDKILNLSAMGSGSGTDPILIFDN